MSVPRTLGDLRRSNFSEERLRTRRVKDELRDNLVARLREKGDGIVFPALSATTTRSCRRSLTRFFRVITSFCSDCADRRKAASCGP